MTEALTDFISIASGPEVDAGEIEYIMNWAMRGPLSLSVKEEISETAVVFDTLDLLNDVGSQATYQNFVSNTQFKRKSSVLELIRLLAIESKEENPLGKKVAYIPNRSNIANHKEIYQVRTPEPSDCSSNRDCVTFGDLSERQLVREIVFCIQGLDGEYLRFDGERYSLPIDMEISRNAKIAVLKISELGTLYRRLSVLMQQTGDSTRTVFKNCVSRELSNFQGLAVIIDSKADSWGLVKLTAWVSGPLLKFRHLHALAVAARNKEGASLLSLIYEFCTHGGYGKIYFSILKSTLVPFIATLREWLEEGNLGQNGFFVIFMKKNEDFWRDAYSLDENKIPCFLTKSICLDILLAGKSVRFLRNCSETDWLRENLEISWDMEISTPESLVSILEEKVSIISKFQNSRVVSMLKGKLGLLSELDGIKKFLLLSQGDFAGLLLDNLGPVLSQPARSIYRHTILALLDQTLRAVGGMEQVDCELRPGSSGESGWDVFSLNFHVSTAVKVIVNEAAMHRYQRLGGLLWRMARGEWVLREAWAIAKQGIEKFPGSVATPSIPPTTPRIQSEDGVDLSVDWETRSISRLPPSYQTLLHKCHCMRQDMFHFTHTLRSFICYEVVETCWQSLAKTLEDCSNLDQLISAHESYLVKLMEGSFLEGADDALEILTRLSSAVLRFATTQQAVFTAGGGKAYGLPSGVDINRLANLHEALDEVRSAFLGDMKRLLDILDRSEISAYRENRNQALKPKLNFNEYFSRWAR